MRRKLSTVFAISMVVAMLFAAVVPVGAAPVYDQSPTFTEETDVTVVTSGIVVEPKGAVGPATYIVQLSDAPLASYRGRH